MNAFCQSFWTRQGIIHKILYKKASGPVRRQKLWGARHLWTALRPSLTYRVEVGYHWSKSWLFQISTMVHSLWFIFFQIKIKIYSFIRIDFSDFRTKGRTNYDSSNIVEVGNYMLGNDLHEQAPVASYCSILKNWNRNVNLKI